MFYPANKSLVFAILASMAVLVSTPASHAQTAADYAGFAKSQKVLEAIRQELETFSLKVSGYYEIKKQGDEYTGPLRQDAGQIPKVKPGQQPQMPPVVENKRFPPQGETRSRLNTILHMERDKDGKPFVNPPQPFNFQSVSLDDLRSIFYTLPNDEACEDIKNCQTRSSVVDQMADWKMSQPYSKKGAINKKTYKRARKKKNWSIDAGLSLDGLLGPLAYDLPKKGSEQQTNAAYRFIQLVSEQVLPLKLRTAVAKEKLNEYLAKLRHYTAQESVGLSNYYQMMARRIKTANQGDKEAKSQWQREQERASYRLDANWRKEMNEAPPLVIQREILYALADMNYQLMQMRLAQERMLATQSAAQLMNVIINEKRMLSQQVGFVGIKKSGSSLPTPKDYNRPIP